MVVDRCRKGPRTLHSDKVKGEASRETVKLYDRSAVRIEWYSDDFRFDAG
jgi:hypothetical protein